MSRLCTALLFTALSAAIAPPLPAAEPVLLDEIVVKGKSIEANEEVLTIREVRESAARDIGEALQGVPGLVGLRKGAIANDVVLRGLQRDNINVLMDGVRVHGGCPSRMDPPAFHFDFAEVESIEVVKGPYDLRFAGSLGGLVNAVSKAPEPGLKAAAVATYGSYDLLHASLNGSYADENGAAVIGYATKYSLPPKSGDGRRLTDIYPTGSRNRYRPDQIDAKAYDIDTVWVKGARQLNGTTRTELGLAYQDATHVLYPALLMDAEYDRTTRLNWTTTVERPGDLLEAAKLQVYWTDVEHLMHDEYRESSRPTPMITRKYMMQTDAETGTLGLNLSGTLALDGGELLAGVDAFRRTWDAVNESAMYLAYRPQPMIPDVDHHQFGLFAEYTRPLGETLKLKGGIRLDYADADATALDGSRLLALYQPYFPTNRLETGKDFVAPSANLQLTWQAADGVELYAGLASASRMPDAEELYIGLQRIPTMMNPTATNWIGNPDLDPVHNHQADLGVKLSGDRFYLSGSLFYSRIDDYITLATAADPDGPGLGTLPPAKTYRNVDARLWGGELSGQVSLPWDLYALATLAYTEGTNRDNHEPLAEIPPLSGSVGLRYDVDRWFVEITERFADDQERTDDRLGEEATRGWAVTDLKAGIRQGRWTVYAGVNNLFDTYYVSHLSYQRDPFRSGLKVPEVGSFAYVTLAYRF